VMPVTAIERHTVGGCKVGPLTEKMYKYFSDYVETQCVKLKQK